MNSKIIIRKDLSISFNRYTEIILEAGRLLNRENTKVDVLECMNVKELYNLEAILIEEGFLFEWIEKNKTILGILIKSDTRFTNNTIFLEPYREYTPDVEVDNINKTLDEHKLNRIKLSKYSV